MPFARKGDGRPHGAPRRPRRARREGAASSDCRSRRARRRRVGPRARPRPPRRVPHRRHDNPRAAPARRPAQEGPRRQRRRLQPGDRVRARPPCAPRSPGSRAETEARRDRQEGRHVEDGGAQEQGARTCAPWSTTSPGPAAGGDGEKVEHRGAVNLLNIDHDGQVQEMIDLAEVARRSPQPVQHWILSWREGEQPTRAQADEAVAMFLAEMGLGEHQAIYALHRDTHNCHVHVAVNRVHPDDGEGRHRQQRLRPRGRPPRDRPHRAAPGLGARSARALCRGRRMVAPSGSGLGTEANGSRPVGPGTSRSARANAAPSGSRSRRPRRSSGRREAGASCTTPSPPRGCDTRRRAPARCSGSASSRSRRAPPAATARWRRCASAWASSSRRPSTPVRGAGSIASPRPIGAHAARLPRRTTQALPGTRGQTGASNR